MCTPPLNLGLFECTRILGGAQASTRPKVVLSLHRMAEIGPRRASEPELRSICVCIQKLGQKQGVPPFWPLFDTFTPQASHARRPHEPPATSEPLQRPPQALFCSPEQQLAVIISREGVGVAPRSQVGHVVTLSWFTGGVPNLDRFHRKVSKSGQKGGTPCF